MDRKNGRAMCAAMGAVVALGAATAEAGAHDAWTCRATVASVEVGGQLRVEPLLANGLAAVRTPDRTRCATDDAGPMLPQIGPVTASLLRAATSASPEVGSTVAQVVTARTELADVRVVVGDLVITAQAVRASAAGRCADGVPQLSGDSRVERLTIGGQEIALDDPVRQVARAVDGSPLGAVVSVAADEEERTSTSLVRRALRVQVARGGEVVRVVLGEAQAGLAGEPCAAAPPAPPKTTTDDPAPPTTPVTPRTDARACPAGATLDTDSGMCVIVRSDGTTGTTGSDDTTGSALVVGPAGSGPSGGRVVALADLPAPLRRSPCASGAGPPFAIIGTSGRDHVTGSNGADRILTGAGADNVAAGRGGDCVDGGAGRDVLGGAEGNDRLYGSSGPDALRGGFGNDRLDGGSGPDTMVDGFGDDRIVGGSGADALNVAQSGRPARHVDCGTGRDTVRLNREERRRSRGCERMFVVR